MPTVCIQCSLEAIVKAGKIPAHQSGFFLESPEEHMRLVHPNGVKPEDRAELERQAELIIRNLTDATR